MSAISTYVAAIRNAVYGKDVRESIAKSIEEIDRSTGEANQEVEAAHTGSDGKVYANLKEAINNQIKKLQEQITSNKTASENADKTLSDNIANGDKALDNRLKTAESTITTHGNDIHNMKEKEIKMEADIINNKSAAENSDAELANDISSMQLVIDGLNDALLDSIKGFEIDEEAGTFSLLNEAGDVVIGPVGPFAVAGSGGGSGSGGGGSTQAPAKMSMDNVSGWASITIADGGECPFTFSWSSMDGEVETGNGVLTITVGNIVVATMDVTQGEHTIDLGEYVSTGSNKIRLTITDSYDQSRYKQVTVNVIDLRITSDFDASTPFEGAIPFSYIPIGSVAKTVYIEVDGEVVNTNETSITNRQINYVITALSHGSHVIRCWFTSTINGKTVSSNILRYEVICLATDNTEPVITSSFNKTEVNQYDTLQIGYTIYDPAAMMKDAKIYANDVLQQELTVDRSEQVFSYRAETAGSLKIKIEVEGASKELDITVKAVDIDVSPVTDGLLYHFSSYGRSNNEANPTAVEGATMTGFNGISDLWQVDNDGVTTCRISGGASMVIDQQPFATDFRASGMTISLGFATSNTRNFDAEIVNCMSGDRGLVVTGNEAILKSEQSEIRISFKENEHIDLAFVVRKRSSTRLMELYVDGILSGLAQYPDNDDFSQIEPVKIKMGSDSGTIDVYNVRLYDHDLSRQEVLDNWIADTQIGSLMLERYTRNNVYDAYGNIDIDRLPSNLPYVIIEGELPTYKGDKKIVTLYFVDPVHPEKSFVAENVEIDVQGTSSAVYYIKNLKLKFKDGFTLNNGTKVAKYAMNDSALPVNTFCFKADVASSEGANNVELVRLYNDICPYKTDAQLQNEKVRQGIDGFPMVLFHRKDGVTTFKGKYNFNNDKSTEEVFGFVDGDESWEVRNNTSNLALFRASMGWTDKSWLDTYEARYPDTKPAYENYANLKELTDFVSQCAWDENTRAEEKTSKIAKFKAGIGQYAQIEDLEFYYLFTELFLMIDSRAKNMFVTFM